MDYVMATVAGLVSALIVFDLSFFMLVSHHPKNAEHIGHHVIIVLIGVTVFMLCMAFLRRKGATT